MPVILEQQELIAMAVGVCIFSTSMFVVGVLFSHDRAKDSQCYSCVPSVLRVDAPTSTTAATVVEGDDVSVSDDSSETDVDNNTGIKEAAAAKVA
jgi:hypothetical protein